LQLRIGKNLFDRLKKKEPHMGADNKQAQKFLLIALIRVITFEKLT